MKPFLNQDRNRYYGLRLGDIVSCREAFLKQFPEKGMVSQYGGTDNNCVFVRTNGRDIKCVAEWLALEIKVEDINFASMSKTELEQLPALVLEATYGQRCSCSALTSLELGTV